MLTNSGATLGIPKICTFATTFNDGIAAFLEISPSIDHIYLYYFLKSKSTWFLKEAARGQGQPNLNTDIIKQTAIAIPPFAEQSLIVARIEQLMTFCDVLEAKLREERAAAEQLAEVLCAVVAAGQAVEQPSITAHAPASTRTSAPLAPPHRGPSPTVPLDAYTVFTAWAVQQHQGTPYARTLGHVKLEKMAHLAEAYAGIDLGRQPKAMPRGPADFDLLKQVIERGRELNAFDAPPRKDSEWGYQFVALPQMEATASRFTDVFGEKSTQLARLVELMLPLKSRNAETVATLYAVWNDMLRDGTQPDDKQIFAAFRAFHRKKKHFAPKVLIAWLAWMREHGIVPDGSAKPTLPSNHRATSTASTDFTAASASRNNTVRRATEVPAVSTAGKEYQAAVALLVQRGTLTNGDLQVALEINATEARALLKQLVAGGIARQEGERRGARYVRVS